MSQTEVQLIKDAVIVNADISNSAAIDVSKISGALPTAGGTITGDVTFDGATAGRDIVFDRSDNALEFADDASIKFGTGGDLTISHDATNSTINSQTGNLRIRNVGTLSITKGSSENMALFIPDGAVELYHDNSKKFETTSGGVEVFGVLQMDDGNSHIKLIDGARIDIGTGADLMIYHSSTQNFIRGNATTSPLYIDCCENVHIRHLDTDGSNAETMIKAIGDGNVELYSNNVKRFQTRSGGGAQDGIVVYGNSSNVAINLFTDTSERGTVYANSSNMVGFLDSGGDWAIRHTNDSQTEFFIATNRKAAIDADGLKFGSDTAAANALDDYEEGTWTPAIGSGSTTISNPRYTKIGNLVHVHFYAQGFTDVSSTTPVSFSGLPYTSASDNIATGNPLIAKISFNENIVAYIGGSTTTVNFFDYGSGDYDHVRHNNINGTDTTHRIFIGITYRAA
jgi:hypothetical protein